MKFDFQICACYLFALIAVFLQVECSKPPTFNCYSDLCNVHSDHQYCSEKFKYCRYCEEVKDDCGSSSQPLNCTGYCVGIAVKEALEMNNKEETSCLVVPMMLKIPNGIVNGSTLNASHLSVWSNLTYSCNKGYTLQGSETMTCTRNGKWSQSELPICLENFYLYYKRATITLAVICAVLLLVLVIIVIVYYKRKKRKESLSRNSTINSLIDEEKPFIGNTNTEQDERDITQVYNGTKATHHANSSSNLEDTVKSVQSPTSSTFHKSNLKENDEKRTNCSFQEPRETNIVNLFIQNEGPIVQRPLISPIIHLPETSEQSSNQTEDRLQNNQTPAKNEENADEKLSTEESKGDPCQETTDEKMDKGTKPLPGRNEAVKPLQETIKMKGNQGPEAVPAEDDEIELSTSYESSQGKISKKIGFHGVTYTKDDITDRRSELQGGRDTELYF